MTPPMANAPVNGNPDTTDNDASVEVTVLPVIKLSELLEIVPAIPLLIIGFKYPVLDTPNELFEVVPIFPLIPDEVLAFGEPTDVIDELPVTAVLLESTNTPMEEILAFPVTRDWNEGPTELSDDIDKLPIIALIAVGYNKPITAVLDTPPIATMMLLP